MQRAEPVGHFVVATVNGQSVLHEVVRAEAEEVHLARYHRRDEHGRRNFDHRADAHAAYFAPLALQILSLLFEYAPSAPHVRHVRNHREHEVYASACGGAQHGARLRAKYVLVAQAEANRAEAERGVTLLDPVRA